MLIPTKCFYSRANTLLEWFSFQTVFSFFWFFFLFLHFSVPFIFVYLFICLYQSASSSSCGICHVLCHIHEHNVSIVCALPLTSKIVFTDKNFCRLSYIPDIILYSTSLHNVCHSTKRDRNNFSDFFDLHSRISTICEKNNLKIKAYFHFSVSPFKRSRKRSISFH